MSGSCNTATANESRCFSPSGRFLAVDYVYRDPRVLEVWELTQEGKRRVPLGGVSGVVDFSPDERTLAVGRPDGTIDLLDLPTGRRRERLPAGAPPEMLAFRPDGQALAVASIRQPVVELRELPSGEIVRKLKHAAGVQAVARGQSEAAFALGLHRGLTMKLVVIPQAMRLIVPPLTSQYLNVVKNSSLAVFVGYPDLVQIFAGTVLNQTQAAVQVMSITMAVYLSVSLAVAAALNAFNASYSWQER